MSVGIVHLRSTHVPVQGAHWTFCAVCDDTWPCLVVGVLDALDEARLAVAHAKYETRDEAEAAARGCGGLIRELTARAEKAEAAIARVRAVCEDEYVCRRCPMPSGAMCVSCTIRHALDGSDD